MEFLGGLSSYYWYTDYYVLYDENNLTADKIEVLTYRTVILITYLNELFDRTKEWSLLGSLLVLIHPLCSSRREQLNGWQNRGLTYRLCYLYQKGVSVLIHHYVLHGENNLTADKIEVLTYRLCYLYQKGVSPRIDTPIMFFTARTT
jgi:hypothetical protein